MQAAIERTASAERELAKELLKAVDRHRDEHDVQQLGTELAEHASARLDSLARAAVRYGIDIDTDVSKPRLARGRGLLEDLEELHARAARASIAWTAVAQGAQALRDRDVLDTASECHADVLRTLRWTTQKVKEAAPQALSG